MAFSSNAWYSIQNFGNDFFLGCQNVGNCATGERGLDDAELFQIAAVNGSQYGSQSYYLRPKAQKASNAGEPYCVNINTGWPTVATCNNQSAIWGIGNWNSQNSGDGRFFFDVQRGDSQRLFLSNNQSYSLLNYNGLSESNLILMQWGVSSRAAINDQSYSTVPAAVTGGSAVTTTSANTTSTSTSSGSSGSGSTSSGSSVTSTGAGQSTLTMVVTPTVTATQASGSRTSTSSVIPTVVSGADRPRFGVKTVIAVMLILPQIWSALI